MLRQPPAPPRKAVVLGGAGFLGRRVVALLGGGDGLVARHAGWPRFDAIHVLDRDPFVEEAAARRVREGSGIALTSVTGDVRSKDDVRRAVDGAHTVFHLASVVDVSLRRNPVIEEVNVGGTRNVVEACRESAVPCLVYTSSEDVVFSEVPCSGSDESLPYPSRPLHDYVRTKIEGEKLVRGADAPGGMRTCAIRPVHIYGPDDPHAIVKSLESFASGSVPFLFGDGSARFDCVYVDNVAHAHLLAASRLHDAATAASVAGRAYFATEGFAPNYFDFLRPFAEARGIAMPTRRLPNRGVKWMARAMELVHRITGADVPFHLFHYYILCQDFFFTNANAARDLGYRPIVETDEAMARTVAWVKTARIRGAADSPSLVANPPLD